MNKAAQLLVALAVGALTAVPAIAATSHFYVPVESFQCVGGACTPTTYLATFGSGDAKPLLSFTNSDTATAHARFWFPASYSSADLGFNATVHYITGTNGSQKYCWGVGAAFLKNALTGGVTWGNIEGNEGVQVSAVSTDNTVSAGYKVSASTSTAFFGYDDVGGITCTPGACSGQPGFLWLSRISSICSSGTAATGYIVGVDVSWTTP